MLNLEQLAAFIAAAEKGSFSAAARHIGKSQSSVSIGVNNLELDLGVSLFDRSTKYPKMTNEGKRLYEHAKVLMRQAERMKSYAQGVIDEVEDSLTIVIDPLVPFSIIDTALTKMAQKFPYTQIKINKLYGQALTNSLLNEESHIGIHIPSKAVPENFNFVTFSNIDWVCVCSPDSEFADMDLVDNETLIANRQIVCSSMVDNEVLSYTGILSQETWQAHDQDDMVRLVEQGLGWALLPKSMAIEKQAMGTLMEFKPEFQGIDLVYPADLIWKVKTQQGPVMAYLIELLTP